MGIVKKTKKFREGKPEEASRASTGSIEKLRQIVDAENRMLIDIGAAYVQLQAIENALDEWIEKIESLRDEKTKIIQFLREEYGDGTIDLEKGKFIPNGKDIEQEVAEKE